MQPVLDYCSQLWSPHKAADIQAMEAVQRSFTAYIWEAKGLNYWDRLQKLGLYSQQRRRERYRIIYTWTILEGLVPNLSPPDSKIVVKLSPRVGRMCCQRIIPSQASGRVRTLLAASLTYKGPQLLNSLPRQVRNMTNYDAKYFKNQLDKFLSEVFLISRQYQNIAVSSGIKHHTRPDMPTEKRHWSREQRWITMAVRGYLKTVSSKNQVKKKKVKVQNKVFCSFFFFSFPTYYT